ncbi:response regulator [Roseiterribacter gracilis]|uniref:DNA-binding response regulator n=1 Tax=Roseiterribacter gracilis TaxID=2812848 RepID=A0A8S8XBB4_9PROT|nr:DNA-binding response regulator [Rhodospirillales bacterium TMPK1]
MSDPVCVLIADDHALVRQGVRLFLEERHPEADFVEADGMETAFDLLASHKIDIAFLDLSMPGMQGALTIRALRDTYPDLRIVVLTGIDERTTILACLAGGTHGYVLKTSPIEEVDSAFQTVRSGGIYVTPALARCLDTRSGAGVDLAAVSSSPMIAPPLPSDAPVMRLDELTTRQRDVLGLLAEGSSTKEIARRLGLGEGTIKVHLAAIFRALGARNRTEAVVLASRLKI